jgi:ssDNA-binding Zn-finger/Zn-ribbon topoisomerase 1
MKSIPRCPRCSTQLVLQKSRLTTYLVCPKYPHCKSPAHFLKPSQTANECCRAA